jgi:hypothetical protein
MRCILLEKRTEGRLDQVRLYDDFYTHYVEQDGETSMRNITYAKVGKTKQECLQAYQEEGFGEV